MKRFLLLCLLVSLAAGTASTAFWLTERDVSIFDPSNARLYLGIVLVLVLLSSCNLAIRWLRWHFITRRFVSTLPTRTSLHIYLGTLAAFATPLYAGEMIRTALAARRDPSARGIVFQVWFVERLTDAVALGSILLAARSQWLGLLAMVSAIGLVLVSLRTAIDNRVVKVLIRPLNLFALSVSSILAWGLASVGLWTTFQLLSVDITLGQGADVFASGTFLGALSLIPLGSGVTSSSMILRLEALGISESTALVGVALIRLGTTGYSLGFGVAAFARWHRELVSYTPMDAPQSHFDELAEDYGEEIPEHVRARLVDRKIEVLSEWLASDGKGEHRAGLEVGCGHAWYAAEMARRGHQMTVCDLSEGQLREARKHLERQGVWAELSVGSASHLPYASASFEFAYAINVLHHIAQPEDRTRAFAEMVRVLKPGGAFYLMEMNTINPLFAFYMGYVFPLVRKIDDGTEAWIRPTALPQVEGAEWDPNVEFLTFLPDFIPRGLLGRLEGIEAWLEQSRWRGMSAHYVARLIKKG